MLHSDINSQGGLIWSKNLPKHSLKSYFRWDFLFAWRVWPYIFTIWTAMAHTASRPMLYSALLDSLGSNQFEPKCSSLVLIDSDPNWSPKRSRMPSWMPWRNAAWLWHFPWNPWAWRAPCGVASWRTAHWALGFAAMKPQNLLFNKLPWIVDVSSAFWNWGWEIPRRSWWFSREIDLLLYTLWVVKSILLL